jgi:hypothetical protein
MTKEEMRKQFPLGIDENNPPSPGYRGNPNITPKTPSKSHTLDEDLEFIRNATRNKGGHI